MHNTPLPTPWGHSQTITLLAENCYFVTTASHGGLFVPRHASRQTPPGVQQHLFPPTKDTGHWMEEDCEAPMAMAFIFPSLDPVLIEAALDFSPSLKTRNFWINAALSTANAFTHLYGPLIPLLEELSTATPTS